MVGCYRLKINDPSDKLPLQMTLYTDYLARTRKINYLYSFPQELGPGTSSYAYISTMTILKINIVALNIREVKIYRWNLVKVQLRNFIRNFRREWSF